MTTSTPAPQRLYLMQVATLPPINMPAVCYLIQTGDNKNILLDTGLSDNLQLPPGFPMPELGQNVIEQLALLDLQPDDIDLLICTHFDLDHAGQHGAFTRAQFVVQRKHYEQARENQRFAMTRPQWDQPPSRYRFLDGDTELLPGLTLIETSGHTAGHQSVLVQLPATGPVLLTIDAVPEQESFTPDRPLGPFDEDEEGVRASVRKLLDLVQREQVALVIFGHDGKQWPTLKKVPEYYA